MINYIFSNNWDSMQDLINYIDSYDGSKFLGQGYFSKVYDIDGYIVKINSGDPDYGYMSYREYCRENPSIHSPRCFRYRILNLEDNYHYLMLTERLNDFPYSFPEPLSISILRESLKSIIYDDIDIFSDNYKRMMTEYEFNNICGIYNFFKDYKDKEYNLDICIDNIKLRKNIWILNDPLTKIINI